MRVKALAVTDGGIVRERLPSDPPCTAVTISDLEGELFFGAAPALEAELEKARPASQGQRYPLPGAPAQAAA